MLIFTTNVLLFDSVPDGQLSFDGFSATAFLAQFFTAAQDGDTAAIKAFAAATAPAVQEHLNEAEGLKKGFVH